MEKIKLANIKKVSAEQAASVLHPLASQMSCVSHCAQAPGSNESCVEGKADLSCVSSRNARLLNFRANSCFCEISELRKRHHVMS